MLPDPQSTKLCRLLTGLRSGRHMATTDELALDRGLSLHRFPRQIGTHRTRRLTVLPGLGALGSTGSGADWRYRVQSARSCILPGSPRGTYVDTPVV